MEPKYPYVLKLKHPIQYGSQVIGEIRYRRPRAKDLKRIRPENMETGDLINLFAAMSEYDEPTIDEMDAEDALVAIQLVGSFLANGQETGA